MISLLHLSYEAVSFVYPQDGQLCQQQAGGYRLLQRSNSAGNFPISQPRVRPTNLIPNDTPKYGGGSGRTETLTPSRRVAWLAAQSDESLQNHPELLQAEVDKIVQRLVPEPLLDPIMEQSPHLHPDHLPAPKEEQLERCAYPQQRVLHPLNTVSVGGISFE